MALSEQQRTILAAILERAVAAPRPELAWDDDLCDKMMDGGPPLNLKGALWDERNSHLLREAAVRAHMQRPTWLTNKEIAERQGSIDPEAIPVEIMVQGRPALVYNVTQTRGLSDDLWRHFWEIQPVHHDPRDRHFDRFVSTLDVPIRHSADKPRKGSRAAYQEDAQEMRMPPFEMFYSAHDYYLTLAHELVHWADHSKDLVGDLFHLGDDEYAFREMVAELGAAFTCAELGLSTVPRDRTVAYIRGWRDDGGFNDAEVRLAAEDAARAVNWLVHSAPGWSAAASEPDRPARQEPRLPPSSRSHRFASASTLADAAAARRFVADALALERLMRGTDRAAWDREAARLLDAARAIDLQSPAVAAAIEAAAAIETSADAIPVTAASWLRDFQERTKRILSMRSLAKSAADMSINLSRGSRVTP